MGRDHDFNLTAAARTHKPLAPFRNAYLGAVALGHLGKVGLDLTATSRHHTISRTPALAAATAEGLRLRKPIPLERFLSFPLGTGVGATNGNVCPLAIKEIIVVESESACARSFRGRGADNRRMGDPTTGTWLRPANESHRLCGPVEPGVNLSRPTWKNASQLEPYVGRIARFRRVRLIVVGVVTTPHAETSARGLTAMQITQDANDPSFDVCPTNSKGVEQPLRALSGCRGYVGGHC
jgi:hypothetical protein